MPSHYDEAKKCRVGTMDERQFYGEAAATNGAWFKRLIAAWQKAGGTLQWGAGGVGLRKLVGGKEVGVCFLAPAFAGKKDRVEFSLTMLGKAIGAGRCASLKAALQQAAGERCKGNSMLCVIEPGSLPAAGQKAVTAALLGL
ncbi:MAG: hypothetical protein WAT39_05965 [Planctomycetota bacterium]